MRDRQREREKERDDASVGVCETHTHTHKARARERKRERERERERERGGKRQSIRMRLTKGGRTGRRAVCAYLFIFPIIWICKCRHDCYQPHGVPSVLSTTSTTSTIKHMMYHQ